MIKFSDIVEMIKILVNERDRNKQSEVKIELLEKVANAQQQYLDLFNRYTELEKEKDALKASLDKKSSYDLVLLSEEKGFYAYQYNQQDQTPHYICQLCFDIRGNKVVLSIQKSNKYCFCPSCGRAKGVYLDGDPQMLIASAGRRQMPDMLKNF